MGRNNIFFIFCLMLFISCTSQEKESISKDTLSATAIEKTLERVNKQLIAREDEMIDAYLKRYQLKTTTTPSGLRYVDFEKGSGEQAKEGKIAVINYELSLLTGDIIYSSQKEGKPKEFLIGKGNVERGLEEGILLMKVGDKIKLIIPSYQAHGFLGDDNRIPKRAVVVYQIELVTLN